MGNVFLFCYDYKCEEICLWCCYDLSFRPNLCQSFPVGLLRSASTTCMLVNKTLVVTISLRTYSLVFASMRTHLLIALGVPALTL